MPESIHHKSGGSIDGSNVPTPFDAGTESFRQSTVLFTSRIGILVPVIMLQVGILVP